MNIESLFVPLDRPRVMGVLNVTPDSFSDGGKYPTSAAAVAHGRRLLADGADLIDIGGESTRPGATRPLLDVELSRVLPVIEALVEDGAIVSVDTMRAEVARAALAAGALVVNDVSGGLADPEMLDVVAAAGAAYIAMHWRAHSEHMGDFATYDERAGGVVAIVAEELAGRLEAILAAGVASDRIVLDPGLGFAKQGRHDWEILGDLDPLLALGHPVLVGTSRKSFLGRLLQADGEPRDVTGREHATTALSVLLARRGIWGLRVHDARACRDALRVVQAMAGTRDDGPVR